MMDAPPSDDRPLEGPGSEQRLAALRAKFRGALHRPVLDPTRMPGVGPHRSGGGIRLGYWLTPVVLGASSAFGTLAFLDLAARFDSPALAARRLAAAPHCAAARAADLAPARKSDPGYWSWLDDDGDGVACERRGR
jgi:hypothetical protein